MQRIAKGFELQCDHAQQVLTLRLHSCWNAPLIQTFETEFRQKVREISGNPAGWYLLVNIRRYPPQSEEAQVALNQLLAHAKAAGMKQKAVVAEGTIGSFCVGREVPDPDLRVNFYFQSEQDALRWLLHESSDAQNRREDTANTGQVY
jgi:hypothetical protein